MEDGEQQVKMKSFRYTELLRGYTVGGKGRTCSPLAKANGDVKIEWIQEY